MKFNFVSCMPYRGSYNPNKCSFKESWNDELRHKDYKWSLVVLNLKNKGRYTQIHTVNDIGNLLGELQNA